MSVAFEQVQNGCDPSASRTCKLAEHKATQNDEDNRSKHEDCVRSHGDYLVRHAGCCMGTKAPSIEARISAGAMTGRSASTRSE